MSGTVSEAGVARRALPEIVDFFESLTPQSLARIEGIYSPHARFRDPFSEVEGVEAISRIFEHMFQRLDSPRFVVLERLADGDQAFLTWDFEFRFRGSRRAALERIHGSTHLRFDPDGRIAVHRDYWDAAEELYGKLPVLGALMRWLRRQAAP